MGEYELTFIIIKLWGSLLICRPGQSELGEGNGTPLQYFCLENPMDGGAWWATVHGVAKSRTRLRNFTFTFHFHFSLSCIGEGNGSLLQCSCLDNPRDRGAWWAAICGVAQSWTQLTWLSNLAQSELRLPRWLSGKESACQCRTCKKCGFSPWVRKISWVGNGNALLQYSCLAWMVEPGGQQSMGSQRVRRDWACMQGQGELRVGRAGPSVPLWKCAPWLFNFLIIKMGREILSYQPLLLNFCLFSLIVQFPAIARRMHRTDY